MTDSTNIAPDELSRRRSKARRTAIVLGVVVTAIFITFLITGITGARPMSANNGSNGKLVAKLLGVSVAMFGFGVFVMPPLYETFCEITGLNQGGITVVDAAPTESASDRTIKVRFDATTNSALNWDFGPVEYALDIPVGAPAEAFYFAENQEDGPIAGMATFNVSPPSAARYFVKVECFCFTRQVLEGGERREMPVYFFIQPDLPAEIEEMTLSYTFFKNEDQDVAQVSR